MHSPDEKLVLAPTATQSMPLHPFADIMLELALLMTMVLVARWLTNRFRQPGVLGELLVGVLVGNLGYWLGLPFFTFVMSYGAASPVFDRVWQSGLSITQAAAQVFSPAELAPGGRGHEVLRLLSGDHALGNVNAGMSLWLFSSLGIILLLFHVGLKTGIHQLRRVGSDAARVAVVGALGSVAVALLVIWLLPLDLSAAGRFFIAATLGATSIGVATRMLEDIEKSDTPEGQLIPAMTRQGFRQVTAAPRCGLTTISLLGKRKAGRPLHSRRPRGLGAGRPIVAAAAPAWSPSWSCAPQARASARSRG
jgi:Kef-type K+ transport system membrane component KefB